MLSIRILVIGDDLMVLQSVKRFMQNDSTDVIYAMSVNEALNLLFHNEYSLVIMCIPLPVNSNDKYLRLVREKHPMPIIVIAPKLEVSEKVILFHAGANACFEQPLNVTLCVAQAHSLIKLYLNAKIADKKENPLVFGTELIINSIYRHIIIDGEPLELTRTEFDLLFYMAKHPNQIFSRQQLSTERIRFGHILETFIKSWRMSAKTTFKIPEGSVINLFLLLVKNKRMEYQRDMLWYSILCRIKAKILL